MRQKNAGEVKVKVAVCISVYNDITLIKSLLETIRYFTEYNAEDYGIVILDDGSREEFKLGLRYLIEQNQDWKENLYLIEHVENQGISATWNHLTQFYDSEYTVMLNNDILVTRFWLTSLVYFLENNKVGGVSLPCWFCPPQFIEPIKTNLDHYEIQVVDPITKELKRNQPINYVENNDNAPGMVMCPAGMLFGYKTSLFREVGGFDEGFKSFYEETDFGTTLASRGYPSFTLPFPSCYHVWSHTFGNNPELKAEERMNKSRQLYKDKWGGDINPKDPNHPHRRFMPLIQPQNLKFLLPDSITTIDEGGEEKVRAFYKKVEKQQTEQDIIDSARVGD